MLPEEVTAWGQLPGGGLLPPISLPSLSWRAKIPGGSPLCNHEHVPPQFLQPLVSKWPNVSPALSIPRLSCPNPSFSFGVCEAQRRPLKSSRLPSQSSFSKRARMRWGEGQEWAWPWPTGCLDE